MHEEANKSLFIKFNKLYNNKEDCPCYACPFGKRGEINPREGDPSFEDSHCQVCFKSWIKEKKDEGKICMKCGAWLPKKSFRGMVVTLTHENEDFTYSTSTALCSPCASTAINGMVNKAKRDKLDVIK